MQPERNPNSFTSIPIYPCQLCHKKDEKHTKIEANPKLLSRRRLCAVTSQVFLTVEQSIQSCPAGSKARNPSTRNNTELRAEKMEILHMGEESALQSGSVIGEACERANVRVVTTVHKWLVGASADMGRWDEASDCALTGLAN